MKITCFQLIIDEHPGVPPTPVDVAKQRYEWYSRVWDHFNSPEATSWDYLLHDIISTLPSKTSDVLEQLIAKIESIDSDHNKGLILDVSSFESLQSKYWDQYSNLIENILDKFSFVVIIFGDNAVAKNADSLIDYYNRRNSKQEDDTLVIIDRKGARWDLSKRWDNRDTLIRSIRQYIKPIEDSEFLNLVLEKSKRYFGHFATSKASHIRTHYNLYNLIWKRSRAYEHIYAKIKELIEVEMPDLILTAGMGARGLNLLTQYLSKDLRTIEVNYYSDVTKQTILKDIQRVGKKILIITDVVLKGSTLINIVDEINHMNGEVNHIVSIIGLNNSREHVGDIKIKYLAKLNRPFYDANESCPLCELTSIPVAEVRKEEDFIKSTHREITTYDFWELLNETNSFIIEHKKCVYTNMHHLAYYKPAKLLRMYGGFVAEVISDKINETQLSFIPEVIICPNEVGSMYLSYFLSDCLNISSVVRVDIEDLKRCTPNRVDDPIIEKYHSKILTGKSASLNIKNIDITALVVIDWLHSPFCVMAFKSLLGAMNVKLGGFATFVCSFDESGNDMALNTDNIFFFYKSNLRPQASDKNITYREEL